MCPLESHMGFSHTQFQTIKALMSVLSRISALRENVNKLTGVEAIVNAANESLLGGGGFDGMVSVSPPLPTLKPHHTNTQNSKAEAARRIPCSHGYKTREAKLTKAYNLPWQFIIHTVGPRYSKTKREELLRSV